ncbi:MAG: Gfo/Idh/MocA family oxidoreductase, partial [Pirellula sp.]
MTHRNPFSRRNFLRGTAAGAVVGATAGSVFARGVAANDEIRLAFLSCGGRANELMGAFEKISSVKVVGLCDPDPKRVDKAKKRFPAAKTAADLRTFIDDPDVDAVVVATCNHWHCLAAIWA